MRALPNALAISVMVHGAAIAWVQSRPAGKPEDDKPVRLAPIEVVPAAPPAATVTEVTLLDDNTVAVSAPVASSRSNTRRGKAQQQVTTRRAAIAETPTTVESPPPPRTKLMTMRHPTIEKGPSATFWKKFEANTKPLQPKDIAGERLADELATAESHLNNPKWIANASAGEVMAERERLVAKRYERSTAELQPDGQGTKADHHTFKARFNPDGTVKSLTDKKNLRIYGLFGEFDVTDAMMRDQGIDPYSSYKMKLLDDTREERVAIGKRYRTQQLAQSRHHMQKNLARLWASTRDLAERKQGAFELWDDCAEKGSDELIAGGTAAREYAIGFIRTRFPAGSAEAFTAEELERLNKLKKSSMPFAPYDLYGQK
jgi:hypothetical protein